MAGVVAACMLCKRGKYGIDRDELSVWACMTDCTTTLRISKHFALISDSTITLAAIIPGYDTLNESIKVSKARFPSLSELILQRL